MSRCIHIRHDTYSSLRLLAYSFSYTASQSTNSNATISFNGTRVDLYGTVLDSNGTSYTVTLYRDGSMVQSYSYAPPFSKNSPDLLFSTDTIEGGLYTLDLTVSGTSSVLIKYVSVCVWHIWGRIVNTTHPVNRLVLYLCRTMITQP